MNTAIAGAIITGGKSSRFGDINKARALLGGKTLLKHVHERLQPQVGLLYLNCQPDFPATDEIDSPLIVQDYVANKKGPLNGVLGVLDKAVEDGHEWLLIAPCDTPFIPGDLATRLMNNAHTKSLELVIPSYKGIPQPSLSLWHRNLLQPLMQAVVDQGAEGFKQFYPHTHYELVEWPQADYDPFLNVNHQSDLSEAELILNKLNSERTN
jgi:molybdenum cofactor guanylyltransferase